MAAKKYRMLKAGEVVLPTDEVYVGAPVYKWLCGSLNCGKELPAKYEGGYRRLYIKEAGQPAHNNAMVPCPTCGAACRVYSGNEGTNSFKPVTPYTGTEPVAYANNGGQMSVMATRCPFCGSIGGVDFCCTPDRTSGFAVCVSCGAQSPIVKINKSDDLPRWHNAALDAWNNRCEDGGK